MASVTLLAEPPAAEAEEVWTQLKPVNREFVVKQISKHTWDFAVDISRFSLSSLQNTSANDLLIQEAMSEFGTTVLQVKDQILAALNSSSKEYGQVILEDLNRQLSIVHQRLEAITRESATLNPALKESLASLNGTASAIGSLLTSLKLPSVKGELGETCVLDGMRAAFLGISSVSIEPLGGAGDTDMIIHFEQNSMEIAKVLVESKNRIAWSNSFLAQLQRDMDEKKANFGILVTAALPKDAKTRGYTVADKSGIIIIATPELAPTVALVLYELIRSLDRLSNRGQALQTLLQSRELVDCLANNLFLVEPLRGIARIVDKARADVNSAVSSIVDAIQRNNTKLAEYLSECK
jgi:hypothetical protein